MIGAILTTSIVAGAPLGVLAHRAIRRQRAARTLRIDTPNPIIEEGFVPIGGIDQWVSVRGEDRHNPVVMEIHGGPGASNTIFAPRTRAWEHHFTLARWDMRGAGKTFGRSGEAGQGELTFARLMADALEVAEHVRERCGQPRLILLANSFGSILGLRLARDRPDLFSAYVGTDQNVCDASGEDPGYASALERLRRAKRHKAVAILERMGRDARRWSAEDWRASAKIIAGSDPRIAKVMRELVVPSLWFSPQHRLTDIAHFAKGMTFSARLFLEAVHFDARREGVRFNLPFFIFQGEHDVLTPVDVAAGFFAEVHAPTKEMAIIPDATHFASFWRSDEFLDLLLTRVHPRLPR